MEKNVSTELERVVRLGFMAMALSIIFYLRIVSRSLSRSERSSGVFQTRARHTPGLLLSCVSRSFQESI